MMVSSIDPIFVALLIAALIVWFFAAIYPIIKK